jgi:hypothetical protein
VVSAALAASVLRDDSPSFKSMDALPFPLAKLAENRSKVCDYCFFGGPTKTVPLVT